MNEMSLAELAARVEQLKQEETERVQAKREKLRREREAKEEELRLEAEFVAAIRRMAIVDSKRCACQP